MYKRVTMWSAFSLILVSLFSVVLSVSVPHNVVRMMLRMTYPFRPFDLPLISAWSIEANV